MNKKIEFKYQDVDYCLEYSREAIKLMEQQGFNYDKFMSEPLTMGDLAFEGAFIKNHRGIKRNLLKEIQDSLVDKTKLNMTLLEMIQETYDMIWADNEDESKNTEWKIV